jgi:hypothetical protein
MALSRKDFESLEHAGAVAQAQMELMEIARAGSRGMPLKRIAAPAAVAVVIAAALAMLSVLDMDLRPEREQAAVQVSGLPPRSSVAGG